ncbi:MAG: Response regulator [uncultured bacterium]|nr:MAG: Response regulator [uncultured bacterium]OFW68974.1 MAG: hypothetical protein A2X70_00510 [Alphaproteobacteria bacterium GWC2_42_16]OFW73806.1 MAG: hypothetical protein A2Z80_05760 [Alphaproteobacteria bacterium GWA2_41_27]OFW82088.1 MAG: hypothetical protein A3E50_06570 [Alphaproteobacteria bacterium RIFCSPHIGHO2_12_FULL_42_100]OFW86335.1 MAG: hypothetical protein A2W06_03280 [Alphaproteobacteria bacterium RBG_16_42_14]OFW91229.1 MAG: hypothetical protein A3C41_06210 [Alphaproteobacte
MGEKHRLLIIDDEAEIGNMLKEVGEASGYKTKALTSGQKFFEVYTKFDPTFIILDLAIPDHDGIELLRYLAQRNCIAPIVLESGQDEKVLSVSTTLGKDMGLHMERYFQKPLKLKEIAELLNKAKMASSNFSVDFLKSAIESKNVILHYQPKVCFKTNQVCGLEALARLKSDGGLIQPAAFIPLAEETNLIRPLSHLIVSMAFKEFNKFLELLPTLVLAVNMSPKTFNDLLLPDEFAKMAKEENIDTKQICIEITETAFLEERSTLADIIARFRIKGFILSIDDFGTGFASLSELHRLPFNELKIDQSFVSGFESSPDAQKIIKSIISLGHMLGLTVTAEGIDSKLAWAFLNNEGCDLAQGFYISRPLEKEVLKEWLLHHKEGFHHP